MMGDRGVHTLDSVFWALHLNDPVQISAVCNSADLELHPATAVVTYDFAQRADLPALKLIWYEGQEPPRPPQLEPGRTLPAEGGVLFKGSAGTIMCGVYGNSPRLIPETAMQQYRRPPATLPRITDSHEVNWINACRERTTASAAFDYSAPLTELTLLGNIAKRFPGQQLQWDGTNMRITNVPEANEWVKRPYREGWSL
jgi:hypothetical protein